MIDNNQDLLKTANDYNDYFTRVIKLSKIKRVGYIVSVITHYIFIFLLIFMVIFLFIIIFNIETAREMIASFPIISQIATSETWIIATVWGVLMLIVFIMPFLLLRLYLLIANIVVPQKTTNSLTGDVLSVIKTSYKKGEQALSTYKHCTDSIDFVIADAIVLTALWTIFCVFGWIYSWHDSDTKGIIAILLGCVFLGFIVYLVGYFIAFPYVNGFNDIIKSYQTEKIIEKKIEHLDSLCNSIEDDIRQKEEEARLKKEAEAAEQAEQEWHSLESPEANEIFVEELAKSGSPSACAYLGEKLTKEYTKNIYTKSEKENIYKQAIQYLNVSASAGNLDSRFLYLSLSIQKASYSLDDWESILTELRSIQKSDSFNNNHRYSCEKAIEYVVKQINREEEKSQSIYTPSYPKPYTKPYSYLEHPVGIDRVSEFEVYKTEDGRYVTYSGYEVGEYRISFYP